MRAITRLVAFLALLAVGDAAAQETRLVPVTVDGESVRLEMRVYTPATGERVPTLVFNHGSTGRGIEPARFTRPIDFPVLAKFFMSRGWAVVMPARRGRGGSEGLYDEGFAAHRAAGYTCDPTRALPGADRALQDIEAAMDAILAMPFVDRERVVIGGQSRGGILSVAYAGLHPEQVKGVINFVGAGAEAAAAPPSTSRSSSGARAIRTKRSGSTARATRSTRYPTARPTSPRSARRAAAARSASSRRRRIRSAATGSSPIPTSGPPPWTPI